MVDSPHVRHIDRDRKGHSANANVPAHMLHERGDPTLEPLESSATQRSLRSQRSLPDETAEATEPPDEPTLLREQEIAERHARADNFSQPKITKPPIAGDQLGRYILLRQIGEGGMGVVFEAFDPRLERKVALKLISLGENEDSEVTSTSSHVAQARLVLEAQSQAKLVHPNVVTVYDVGASSHGIYMAMEMVSGQTVKQWQRAHVHPWREVVAVFLQAAAGLAAAHDAGLVHRDFKPDNLLLGEDGVIRVADFGLATGHSQSRESATGQLSQFVDATQIVHGIAGTPSYMAPEQHRGGRVTALSDQYAYCVSLYEALYGSKPFRGANRAELVAAIEERHFAPLAHRRSAPRWLHQVIVQGLSADPRDRFSSLHELIRTLEEGRHRRAAPVVASALGVVLGVGALAAWTDGRSSYEQQCQARAARAHDAWSPETWEQLENSFLASGVPYAKDAVTTVSRVINDRLEEWAARYFSTCRDSQESPTLALPVFECLDDQLVELKTIATVYRAAGRKEVQGAAQLVNGLAHPDHCAVTSMRQADRDRPADPKRLAAYLELTRELQGLRTSSRVAGAAAVNDTAKSLLRQAKALGIPALLAPTFAIRASLDTEHMQLRSAQQNSDLALLFAAASQDAKLPSHVAREQVFLRGYKISNDPAAEDIYQLGQAYLARAGSDAVDVAGTCVSSVPYLMFNGRGNAAERCLRGALDTFQRTLGPKHSETIRALEYLAVTISYQRVDPESEALLLRARDGLVELAGPTHPMLAMTNYNLSSLATAQGALAAASHYYDEAAKVIALSQGPIDLRAMISLGAGETWRQRSKLKTARTHLETSLAGLATSQEPSAVGPRTSGTVALALCAAERGDYSQCSLAETGLEPTLAMPVGGLYEEGARLATLAALRELALECGNLEHARQIEDRRQPREQIYYSQLGSVRPYLDLSGLSLTVAEHGAAPAEKILAQRVGQRPPHLHFAERADLLALRWDWTHLLLDLERGHDALAVVNADASLREVAYATDTTDALLESTRLDALLQLGRPLDGLERLGRLREALDDNDLTLAQSIYLDAVFARATLSGDPRNAMAHDVLESARNRHAQLRRSRPSLKRLLAP